MSNKKSIIGFNRHKLHKKLRKTQLLFFLVWKNNKNHCTSTAFFYPSFASIIVLLAY